MSGLLISEAMITNHSSQKIAVHISWESITKLGGIGTVLENLIVSPDYQRSFSRTILLSPNYPEAFGINCDPVAILAADGEIFYSARHNIDVSGYGAKLQPIETRYNVSILYGKRRFAVAGNALAEAEILMVDLSKLFRELQGNIGRWEAFTDQLKHRLGVSAEIRLTGGYLDYDYYYGLILAEPAFEILSVLLQRKDFKCFLKAHNVLGLPTLYKAMLDGDNNDFCTVFHADECISARYWIEMEDGSDTKFYNILRRCRGNRKYLEDIYGDMSFHGQHRLLAGAYHCDRIVTPSDTAAEELRFLNEKFTQRQINVSYHGIPYIPITLAEKLSYRELLQDYSECLVNYRPDILMSHVARPIQCKGLWRDFAVCHVLDQIFAEKSIKGILYIISSNHGSRSPQNIRQMENDYHWPKYHLPGFPDLQGEEYSIYERSEKFNVKHDNLKIILVNSFDWPSGHSYSKGITRTQFRMAVDVEFGMSMYDAYGISQLEPLSYGAICVVSSACGVAKAIENISGRRREENIIIADYIKPGEDMTMEQLLGLSNGEQNKIETQVAFDIADKLVQRLPGTDFERAKLIASGQDLAQRMSWDKLIKDHLLAVLC